MIVNVVRRGAVGVRRAQVHEGRCWIVDVDYLVVGRKPRIPGQHETRLWRRASIWYPGDVRLHEANSERTVAASRVNQRNESECGGAIVVTICLIDSVHVKR